MCEHDFNGFNWGGVAWKLRKIRGAKAAHSVRTCASKAWGKTNHTGDFDIAEVVRGI